MSSVKFNEEFLEHHGVKGMRWGVRKKDYKTEGFVIKKGSELHRTSTVEKETNKGSGYASFLKEDNKKYRETAKLFSKFGHQHYDMTIKATKDLVSPSQKKRIDVFLKKLETDKEFAKELKSTQRKMLIMNMVTPGDVKLSMNYKELSLNRARTYRMLNQALSGNKKLRTSYLNEFKKLGYDFILDEADSSNKVAKAPIIFIERKGTLDVVKVDKL